MRRPVEYGALKESATQGRVERDREKRERKPTTHHVTSGGRHADPEKLAWLRKQRCLVAENRLVLKGTSIPAQTPCFGLVEPHHHRVRGARANDAKTVPLCAWHHRTAADSLHVLGRRGFESFHQFDLDAECARYEREWQEQA